MQAFASPFHLDDMEEAMHRPLTLIFTLALAGCAGTMHGVVRGTGEAVVIEVSEAANHGDLTVRLPDGELFKGKAVTIPESTGDRQSHANRPAARRRFEAVLFGDRGRTMYCQFRYAGQGESVWLGVTGRCETSDAMLIDVVR